MIAHLVCATALVVFVYLSFCAGRAITEVVCNWLEMR